MVNITLEHNKKKNTPVALPSHLFQFVDQVQMLPGLLSVLYINPRETESPHLLALFLDDAQESIEAYAKMQMQGIQTSSLFWSHFWIHFQDKNAVILNYLRNSAIVFDKGYALPLQQLLLDGKIRPTKESVWHAMIESQESMKRANNHMKEAVVNLYWATVDSAQALLSAMKIIPPHPKEIVRILEEQIVPRNIMTKEVVEGYGQLHAYAKKIEHDELFSVSGEEYKLLERHAEEFMNTVRKIMKNAAKLP